MAARLRERQEGNEKGRSQRGRGEVASGASLPPVWSPPTPSGLGTAGRPPAPTQPVKANGVYLFLRSESEVFKARV